MPTITFPSAVRAKYEHKAGSTDGGELVGGDKTGKKQSLDVLTRVFVPGEDPCFDGTIDGPGDDGEVAKVCGAIEELDLGGNTLADWTPLQTIASQLPKLFWLGLDRMPLPALTTLPDGFAAAFGGLKTLCVSGTGMEWSQLLFLASATPKLEELHFATNKLSTLVQEGTDVSVLSSLTELYLEGNLISEWSSLAPLGHLPKLTLLNLNHNQLVTVPPYTEGDGGFTTLKHLMLRGNPIDAWASIDALNGFPNLTEARLAEMPLTSNTSGAAARRTIIARLGRLKGLNGSEVRPRERDDAERFYLRQVALEYPEGGLPSDAVVEIGGAPAAVDVSDAAPAVDEYGRPIAAATATNAPASAAPTMELKLPETAEWTTLKAKHPRWATLLLQHGTHVTQSSGNANKGGVIANELLEVTMRAISAEAAHLPTVSRKLPGGLPLKSIKLIACQLFKVEPTKMQMLYTPPGQDKDIPEELDDDSKSLADLGVVSGGTIVIDDLGSALR